MKEYSQTGRRNHDRPLKRLLDTWDRNGSTSGLTPWKINDDDDCTLGQTRCQCPQKLNFSTAGAVHINIDRPITEIQHEKVVLTVNYSH
jgi:hypothetical protein